MSYYISVISDKSFEHIEEYLRNSLHQKGFDFISEIDMQEKIKKGLHINFRKYKILGVCNLTFAYKALQVEDRIGTILPCNIIIHELDDGKVEIAAIDPQTAMLTIDNDVLQEIALLMKDTLTKIIHSI